MWAQAAALVVSILLVVSGEALTLPGAARTNALIAGPVAASFATIAIWEVLRGLRWVNVLIGAWLVVAPLALGFLTERAGLISVAAGLLLAAFSASGGTTTGRYGGGWRSLIRDVASSR